MSVTPDVMITAPPVGRPVLLERAERLVLGLRLSLALVALCLLLVAYLLYAYLGGIGFRVELDHPFPCLSDLLL